jgi:hypothetical protein
VYSYPIVAPFPNALPSVSWGVEDGSSSEIPRDSGGQDGEQDADTLSLGLHNAEDTPHGQCPTTLESFGYSEESNSNTMALLRMVSINICSIIVMCQKNSSQCPVEFERHRR